METRSPFSTAMLRGLYGAVLSFAATTLGTYVALPDGLADRWERAAIAGGIAACSALGWRGVIEGRHDQGRDDAGDVSHADVGAHQMPLPPR